MNGYMTRSPFLEEVKAAIRVRHYSIRTEQAYVDWIKRFIFFHAKRHPREMGEREVGKFLTHLAVDRRVSPGTQNQALNALVFMYRHVLERPLAELHGVVRAKRKQRLPVVLTLQEVRAVLKQLQGVHWLAACLMYGSGLRLMECIRFEISFDTRPGAFVAGFRSFLIGSFIRFQNLLRSAWVAFDLVDRNHGCHPLAVTLFTRTEAGLLFALLFSRGLTGGLSQTIWMHHNAFAIGSDDQNLFVITFAQHRFKRLIIKSIKVLAQLYRHFFGLPLRRSPTSRAVQMSHRFIERSPNDLLCKRVPQPVRILVWEQIQFRIQRKPSPSWPT